MMEINPFDKGKSLILKKNNKRLRFLSEEEIERLLPECAEHLRQIAVCAINSGMRKNEILTLKWKQIKNGLVYLDKTKNGESRQVPINDDLAELFKEIRREQGLTSKHVFTYYGRRIKRIDRAFNAALDRADIQDFKFHDLRHTSASHFIMRGGSLKELQEILGHKDIKMTMRYAHLSQEQKKKAVNLLNGLTASSKGLCHKTVTNSKHADGATC